MSPMAMLSSSPSPSLIRTKSAATPPTVTLASVSPLPVGSKRPLSTADFDAGLNSSAAWTAQRAHDALSDDEGDSSDEGQNGQERGRPARALYAFDGKPEFRELSVKAGDALSVIRDDAGDGWSLVRRGKHVGLLPRTYYTYTSEFVRSPHAEDKRLSDGSSSSTPRGASPVHKDTSYHPEIVEALVPQTTGEWLRGLPSFRRSLLGGKSFNRFSSFVTSGAESFVLNGSATIAPPPVHTRHVRDATSASVLLGPSEADMYEVDTGPSWKAKVPAFRVLVHSPSKVAGAFAPAYIVYSVTSLFHSDTPLDHDDHHEHGNGHRHTRTGSFAMVHGTAHDHLARITVPRRFSHFVALHAALLRALPGLALPPLPEKQYAGRFSTDFVEARRGELEHYLARLVRHPVIRYAEVLTAFLSCESDAEWRSVLQGHLSLPPAGASFYARVFHPAFGIDGDEANQVGTRFDAHTKALGRGVQELRGVFARVRDARTEVSRAERELAYSLLSLVTAHPLHAATEPDDEPDNARRHHEPGLVNEDGAWCWRDHCDDCLKLTKAMQKTADTLQIVADLYDDHARRRQLATHEALKGVAHPNSIYAAVIDTHRSTLSRYINEGLPASSDDELPARCETVLHTTMAEMDTYHAQKIQDFGNISREHLDGEIGLYEQILARLHAARATYNAPEYDGLAQSPRQTSMYERELAQPRLTAPPLPQPCPHVFDSAPMRPVTAALQDGVGLLANAAGRASMLSKLW